MKRKIQLLVLLLVAGTAVHAQTYPSLRFRKPVTGNGNSWRFKSVTTNVDAVVTVLSTKNASINQIDDSTTYPYAWNPSITYTNTPSRSTDSSYVEFKVDFVKSNTSTAHNMSAVAMTIVDMDAGLNGLNLYREMIKTSQPATSKGLLGTLISSLVDLKWLTNIAGPTDFAGIDTSNFLAMSQVNYSNVSTYTMKIGVLGRIGAGTTRQHSLYFKNFALLTLALPVELVNLNAVNSHNSNTVSWATTMESNSSRFEIYRSNNGADFELAGQLAARGNSNAMTSYSYIDMSASGNTYYKIRIVDNNGESFWSSIVFVKEAPAAISDLYPNPASSTLNLSLANVNGSDFDLEVVDVFGKIIQSYNGGDIPGSSFSMDITALNKGVYFIKVTDADGNAASTRFIKN